jgi:hypothetical protein
MGYYKIIREQPDGKAVRGTLYEVQHRWSGSKQEYKEHLSEIASTLEHSDYLIPALIYKVQVNLSPKFGTLMPMLMQVPGRSGIRIHFGTKPEHSRGCVLITSRKRYQEFTLALLEEQKTNAPIYIEVRNHND